MLDGAGDNVIACSGNSEDSEVVAFGAAGGEDDLGGATSEQRSDTLARLLDGGASLLSLLVDGRGVAEPLKEVGLHCLEHLWQERRRRVVVQIDALHSATSIVTAVVSSSR